MSLAKKINQAYSQLGLVPGSSPQQVKRAYRRLAKDLHPDLHPGAQNLCMTRLNRAYKTLTEFLEEPGPDGSLSVGQAYCMVFEHFHQGARPRWRPASGPLPLSSNASGGWRLIGLCKEQSRLVYLVEVSGSPAALLLPLRRQKECPHCGGRGIYCQGGQPLACAACRGRGRITRPDQIEVALPPIWRHGQTLRAAGGAGLDGEIWVRLLLPADKEQS